MAAPAFQGDVVDLGKRRRLRVVEDAADTPAGPGRLSRAWAVIRADFRRWRLLAAAPPSLRDWLAGSAPHRVPDDWRLRALWRLDHWTTGLALTAISTAFFIASATGRWVACHPARRWLFIGVTCVFVAWIFRA